MCSRTASESVRTSRPSTKAEPLLSGKRPVSILMTVVFPLPLGPRKPKISPFSTRKLTPFTATKSPKRRTRSSAEMASCSLGGTSLARWLQLYIRGHSGQDPMRRIVDAHLYSEDLVNPLFPGLNVAGKEFGLLIDLFHHSVKSLLGK